MSSITLVDLREVKVRNCECRDQRKSKAKKRRHLVLDAIAKGHFGRFGTQQTFELTFVAAIRVPTRVHNDTIGECGEGISLPNRDTISAVNITISNLLVRYLMAKRNPNSIADYVLILRRRRQYWPHLLLYFSGIMGQSGIQNSRPRMPVLA